jgi:hypothetical protein
MKTILKYALMLLLIPSLASAGGLKGKYSKEKKINKTYSVAPTALLDVNNQYGTIYVTTWDESQIVIDVVIKVSADKENLLDKRLNSIDVAFSGTNTKVTANTRIGNFSGGNVNMEINYTIKIPKRNLVGLTNQYGAIILGKIYGTAKLKVQYGSLTIDELNGTKNEISMQYSDGAKIGYLALTRISAQYSGLKIDRAGDELILNCEYTDTKIGTANRIMFNGAYGELKVDGVSEMTGDCDYLNAKIGTVTKMFNMSFSYGDVKIDRVSKDAREVYIHAEYSDVALKFDANHAFDFQAKTNYGDIRGLQNITIQEKKVSDTSSFYKGYYRSGGSARITLENQYGDISITKL